MECLFVCSCYFKFVHLKTALAHIKGAIYQLDLFTDVLSLKRGCMALTFFTLDVFISLTMTHTVAMQTPVCISHMNGFELFLFQVIS